jgi:hypothetical protein
LALSIRAWIWIMPECTCPDRQVPGIHQEPNTKAAEESSMGIFF